MEAGFRMLQLDEPLEVMPLWGDWIGRPSSFEVRAIVHSGGIAPEAVAFDGCDELVVERSFRRLLAQEALAVLGPTVWSELA